MVRDRDAGGAQALEVREALVAQRVVAGGDDDRGREAAEVGAERRRLRVVTGDGVGQVSSGPGFARRR
jgi:hypothetical protein